MEPVNVTASKDGFERAGKPFFYLADTVWSTFTNTTIAEWKEYLSYRRQQGFNALQINILPQWDRSKGEELYEPFARKDNKAWDFTGPNPKYFEQTKTMAEMAAAEGFVPALVLLWCDYVPGTWGAEKVPGHTISEEELEPYVRYVADTLRDLKPIYLVSGDTRFTAPETTDTYHKALSLIKAHAPESLTTFHLAPDAELPDELVQAEELDFYMYQSGHHLEEQERSYRLAEHFTSLLVKRPVVNGEPCYEGIGYFQRYGRFSAFQVRKAVWQSLLSGAKAGVTYGAHGLWSWHRTGMSFGQLGFWDPPYPWSTALRLPGAWDAAYARWVFETFGLFNLEPQQGTVENDSQEIRLAASRDQSKLAAYIPFATALGLCYELSGYDCTLIELAERRVLRPVLRSRGEGTVIELPQSNGDYLFLALRR